VGVGIEVGSGGAVELVGDVVLVVAEEAFECLQHVSAYGYSMKSGKDAHIFCIPKTIPRTKESTKTVQSRSPARTRKRFFGKPQSLLCRRPREDPYLCGAASPAGNTFCSPTFSSSLSDKDCSPGEPVSDGRGLDPSDGGEE